MEIVNLGDKISEAQATKAVKVNVYGAEKFRSWILCFAPGDGTDMHFHVEPETFLVVEGSGIVRGKNGAESPIRKGDVLCLGVRDYYQIINTGTDHLVVYGNRSEGFGGPHFAADGTDIRKADGSLGELAKASVAAPGAAPSAARV